MTTNDKPLTLFERWMVKSNLERIQAENLNPQDVIALLRVQGYHRAANGLEQAVSANANKAALAV